MHLTFSWATHIGGRDRNEDDCCAVPSLGLFAVADGMGGYQGGEIASRAAIAALIELFQRLCVDRGLVRRLGVDSAIAAAIELANQRIQVQRHGPLARMGATIALVRFSGDTVAIGHVGDSRVYRLRRGQLQQLTEDHSYYAALAAVCGGGLPPRRQLCNGNVITRALGSDVATPDLRTEAVEVGDTFLVCTDGVHDALGDDAIRDLLAVDDVHRACHDLVRGAFAADGSDNITAVVVRASEERTPAPRGRGPW